MEQDLKEKVQEQDAVWDAAEKILPMKNPQARAEIESQVKAAARGNS
ncbi:MAG: hypothetical protein RBR81_02780 [Bacteroidales bacterium]|jgi:hypothetical protein|nr:hypothetical protein [Bacteroidales bacterium]